MTYIVYMGVIRGNAWRMTCIYPPKCPNNRRRRLESTSIALKQVELENLNFMFGMVLGWVVEPYVTPPTWLLWIVYQTCYGGRLRLEMHRALQTHVSPHLLHVIPNRLKLGAMWRVYVDGHPGVCKGVWCWQRLLSGRAFVGSLSAGINSVG